MTRALNHPDYEYKPWPKERRIAHSEAARLRLGVPVGHRRVFGVDVPHRDFEAFRLIGGNLRRKMSLEDTTRILQMVVDLIGR